MSNFTEYYDENDEVATTDFQPIPEGMYLAILTGAEMKPTAKGGEYLSLKFEIVEGEYKKRTVFGNLNLKNSNPLAVKIARGEFAALRKAIEVPKPVSPRDLLKGKPLRIKIKVETRKDTGGLVNKIKDYKPNTPGATEQVGVEASTADKEAAPWAS